MENLGFYETRVSMTLLETVELSQAASMLLGLILGIIVIMFVVISVLLIYSLLMISVEVKTFHNAVLRILGVNKINCVFMILAQGIIFTIPSIVCGYGASIGALYLSYDLLFTDDAIKLSPLPTAEATIKACILGLVIPILASIIPIQTSLDQQLSDSLSNIRSKT
jgi:ABC-type antimicrobial peptide transport system permease subunit